MQGAQPLRQEMLPVALVPAWLWAEPGWAQGLVLLPPSGHQPCRKNSAMVCGIGLPAVFGAGFSGFCKQLIQSGGLWHGGGGDQLQLWHQAFPKQDWLLPGHK